jgi:hypothetical protein
VNADGLLRAGAADDVAAGPVVAVAGEGAAAGVASGAAGACCPVQPASARTAATRHVRLAPAALDRGVVEDRGNMLGILAQWHVG